MLPAIKCEGIKCVTAIKGGDKCQYVVNGELGWRSGESAHLTPMCPGFDSRTRRHMWVEFDVGSHPSSEDFSPGSPVFLPLQNALSQFGFDSSHADEMQWHRHRNKAGSEMQFILAL